MLNWLKRYLNFRKRPNTFHDYNGTFHLIKILKLFHIDTGTFENESGYIKPMEIERYCMRMEHGKDKIK